MPGNTNNTNFMDGINQLIQAINDLGTTLNIALIDSSGVPYLEHLIHLKDMAISDIDIIDYGDVPAPVDELKCLISKRIIGTRVLLFRYVQKNSAVFTMLLMSASVTLSGLLAALAPLAPSLGIGAINLEAAAEAMSGTSVALFGLALQYLETKSQDLAEQIYIGANSTESHSNFINYLETDLALDPDVRELLIWWFPVESFQKYFNGTVEAKFINPIDGEALDDALAVYVDCSQFPGANPCGGLLIRRGTDISQSPLIVSGQLQEGIFRIEPSPNHEPENNNQVVLISHNATIVNFALWLNWDNTTPPNNTINIFPFNCLGEADPEQAISAPTSQQTATSFSGTGFSLIINADDGTNYPATVFLMVTYE